MASETTGLYRHRDLGPRHERHHVGRAESGRIREAQVQVVHEPGSPARRRDPGVHVLGEGEVDVGRHVVCTRRRTASVELPVEQGERDVVRYPHGRAGREEIACRIRLRAAVDEVVDQLGRRPQRSENEHGHKADGEHPELPGAPRDRAGIADDQGDEQAAFDEWKQPPRPETQLVPEDDREHHRREDGGHHRPARLAGDVLLPIFGVRRVSAHRWTPAATRRRSRHSRPSA